jgi:hypothetical protein
VKTTVMLAGTMRILAGASYLDVGWPYGLADATVHVIFDETLAAIGRVLDNMSFPKSMDECVRATDNFQRSRQSPLYGISLLWTAYPLQSHAREKQRIRESSLIVRGSTPFVSKQQSELTIASITFRPSMRAQLTIQPHSSRHNYVIFYLNLRRKEGFQIGLQLPLTMRMGTADVC